jgi:phosphoglycolate phosphatase-like HAD superfamily hydrolase
VTQLLALDFDGVIADSAPEAFVVAVRTFAQLRPAGALAAALAPLLGDPAPPRAAVDAHPLYAAFLALMPLGNRAEDYGVALDALEGGARIADQGAYDAWHDRIDREWLRSFHRAFYRVRTALAERDPAGWNALIGPYPLLPELLRRRAREAVLAIATAKDRLSVGRLLRTWGMDDLFPPGRVLDKEAGVSKALHLAELQRRSGVPFPEITFVDDKVNHLDTAAPLGVRCALAAWGYNGERERRIARERGYLVCGLGDVEIFGRS